MTSVRNEKSNGWRKPSREVDGLYKLLWESTKGLPPGKALLISKQVHSVMPSYPIMCPWYVWCSLTLLMAALWYHQDRWDTQLSRLLTSIFHCSVDGEHLTGQGNWERKKTKKTPRLSLYKHHVMKYKWINGPYWDYGISRQNIPYRLSRLYNHDILIDVTNKHELFSSGIKAGNWICDCVCCEDADGMISGGGNRMT